MGLLAPLNDLVDGGMGQVSPPNTGQAAGEYTGLLSAISAGQPQSLATSTQFDPQYTNLGLNNLNQTFTGTNGAPGISADFSGLTSSAAAAEGNANLTNRAANVAGTEALGPEAFQAMTQINPEQAALMKSLSSTATGDIALGSSLNPGQMNLAQQAAREGQAARGMGFGPADNYGEALGVSQFGNQLLQQRQQFGTNVAGLEQGYTAPVLGQLSTVSNAPSAAFGAASLGSSVAGQNAVLPPAASGDLFNAAFNSTAAANIASANNRTALDTSY